MISHTLFTLLRLILARDYKYVGDGRGDWALVIVILLFFLGAELSDKTGGERK